MSNFSALLDACVIFPHSLCRILLDAACEGLYRVHFSNKILDEAFDNRVKKKRMNQSVADKLKANFVNDFPDALVEAPMELENKMDNHPGDRHVLASAVYGKVDVIVTSNLKHFPASSVSYWNIEIMHPDVFLNYLCDENGDDVLYDLLYKFIASLKKPPYTYLEFISKLEKEQPKFASRMLIFHYSDYIEKFARNVLMTVPVIQGQERCLSLSGNLFQICEVNNGIVINEKTTKREVFRSYDDEITGELKVKDIEFLQKVSE